MSNISLILLLIATVISNILSNIVASLLEKFTGNTNFFRRMGIKGQLLFFGLFFILFAGAATFLDYTQISLTDLTETFQSDLNVSQATIKTGNTMNFFDGEIFVTVNSGDVYDNLVSFTVGAPGLPIEHVVDVTVGYSLIYNNESIKYDVRVAAVKTNYWATRSQPNIDFIVSKID